MSSQVYFKIRSLIEPLLFLIYVDEVTTIMFSQDSKCNLFADDILLFKVLSDVCDFKAIQDDIFNIESWSIDNFLALNPKKCKYMSWHARTLEFSYTINCPGHHMLRLWVLRHERSWVFCTCRHFYADCDSNTILHLYTTLVRPHMEYASSIWAPSTAKDIGALESVQKFACRMAMRNWTSDYQELLPLKSTNIGKEKNWTPAESPI